MARLWAVLYKQPSPFLLDSNEWVPASWHQSEAAARKACRKGGRVVEFERGRW